MPQLRQTKYAPPFDGDICAARLREALSYDADTGEFVWRKKISRQVVVGKVAGCFDPDGYRMIGLYCRSYFAHRLAWLYHYGVWPTHFIDHLDGVKSNNAIANLRDVPHAINMQNMRRPQVSNKRSGVMGVAPNGKAWRATLTLNSKQFHIGTFKTKEEAHQAYLEAKRRMHVGCSI